MTKILTKEYWRKVADKRFWGLSIFDFIGIVIGCTTANIVTDMFDYSGWRDFTLFVVAWLAAILVYSLILALIYKFILK